VPLVRSPIGSTESAIGQERQGEDSELEADVRRSTNPVMYSTALAPETYLALQRPFTCRYDEAGLRTSFPLAPSSIAASASVASGMVTKPVSSIGSLDAGGVLPSSAVSWPATAGELPLAVSSASYGAEWTLLPLHLWSDEFSPRFVNANGAQCEGDPTYVESDDDPELIRYEQVDEETGTVDTLLAVQNEVLVDFHPCMSADDIRSLLCKLGLEVYHAWFSPKPDQPGSSISWFHLGVTDDSPFVNNVPALVTHFRSLPQVISAAMSDVATLCARLYDNNKIIPASQLWRFWFKPDDGTGASMRNLTIRNSRLFAAWADDTADLGTMNAQATNCCVVVMDTGIDVDHEAFDSGADRAGQIYSKSGTSTRDGIATNKKCTFVGNITAWESTPATPPAPTAPLGTTPDPLKFIDLRYRDHGHGTLMAGIIGGSDDAAFGAVSSGIKNVKVMSARISFAKGKVRISDVICNIKQLSSTYSKTGGVLPENAVRVVYLGFAIDANSRPESMTQLLKAMVKDRKDGGTDRIWVAAAANNADADRMSYPAALLKMNRSRTTTTADLSGDEPPAVIGVTGVRAIDAGLASSTDSQYVIEDTNFVTGTAPYDPDVYGITGFTLWGDTTDVRDRWYGTQYRSKGKKHNVPSAGLVSVGPEFNPGANPGSLTDINSVYASGAYFTGFPAAKKYEHCIYIGGDYIDPSLKCGLGQRLVSTTYVVPGGYSLGNSVAAAQIAALAGLLTIQNPKATARQIKDHIELHQLVGAGAVAQTDSKGVSRLMIRYHKPNSIEVRRLPAPVDFLAALQIRILGQAKR
jgi:hypothetical protein